MVMIDLTKIISEETVVYPGDPKIKLTKTHDGVYTTSKVEMSVHSGTHIDAPVHYIKGGKTIDEFPVIRGVAGFNEDVMIPLFKREITEDEAKRLAGKVAVGTSELSIGSEEVHRILLARGALIIENLDLSEVENREYEFLCFPMKIKAEAAPCRCVLVV